LDTSRRAQQITLDSWTKTAQACKLSYNRTVIVRSVNVQSFVVRSINVRSCNFSAPAGTLIAADGAERAKPDRDAKVLDASPIVAEMAQHRRLTQLVRQHAVTDDVRLLLLTAAASAVGDVIRRLVVVIKRQLLSKDNRRLRHVSRCGRCALDPSLVSHLPNPPIARSRRFSPLVYITSFAVAGPHHVRATLCRRRLRDTT